MRCNLLATSPLVRARQTAEGILRQWSLPAPELKVLEELAPGCKRRKLSRSCALNADAIGLVGHLPDLANYAAWLLGSRKIDLDLAKTGLAKITCEDGPRKGCGRLVWLITPEWLE